MIRSDVPLTRRSLTALSIALLAVAIPVFSDDSTLEVLSVADSFDLETPTDPQISPDGLHIVYARQAADVMTDRFYSTLWIVGFDGSGHRPLTTGKTSSFSPRWSPSGDRLAFISTEDPSGESDKKPQIWIRYMDTGDQRPISDLAQSPSRLEWSPDGKWLSFHMLVPGKAPDVADLPTPPPGAKWAEPPRVYDSLTYKHDQSGFRPHGAWHIFVVPSEGGTQRQITTGERSFGGPGMAAGGHVWTPDSKSIVASANLRDDAHLEPLDSEVWKVDVATGDVEAVTDRRGPDGTPTISPDGSTVAFVGFDDRYQGYQVTELYVKGIGEEGAGRSLTKDLDRDVTSPRFSSDGQRIYFMYSSEGDTRLASVNLEGEVQDHASGLGVGTSAYAAGQFSMAPNGNFALTVARPSKGPDIFAGSLDGGDLRQLTDVNHDVLGHRTLGEVEEIWYESSHDGRKVQGWILKPPGFDPDEKYPLILEIHGGPFAAYGPKFDLEKQMMAAAGYVVLYTNPRGSTSYGGEFGNLIHHAYPGHDLHDLLSGVDAVIEQGYIDEEELFVTGGSGGGVLTSWVIGNSDRFRAAVTIYPVINWYSWLLTADISAFGWKYWFPGLPWDMPEHYEKRSLLSVVKNVTTPTMVLTGEEDHRTPMSESEQYFAALQLLGVESVFVRVPEEPHGIRARPSHHAQKMAFIVGWFDRHRKGSDEEPTAASSM